MAKLTKKGVDAVRVAGTYADGDGLYLQVARAGSKSWIYRYQIAGRRRELGLGGGAGVPLAEAREKAADARRLVKAGTDPIEAKRTEQARAEVATARATTFKEAAIRYIAAHQAGWRNAKHRRQWASTLEAYCFPHFGTVPVNAVDVGMVLKAVEPIWATKSETAGRVRGRIEAILDWAKARGLRDGENPARWRGHLDHLLPARSKVRRVKHHAALPYGEIGEFMAQLRQQDGIAARALEFCILTCARTGEALGARWDEVNLAERVWTLPAERMKAGREHRVPLSDPALAVLDQMARIRLGDFVFGSNATRAISNMGMLMLLRRMRRADITTHGFRSSFRDWAAERTNFPAEVAEMALAHAVGDKVEAAYRRGDLFEKRRQLAQAWSSYCTLPPASAAIVPIRSAG